MSDFYSGSLSNSSGHQTPVARVGRSLDTEDHGSVMSLQFVEKVVPRERSEIVFLVGRDECRRQGEALGLCGAYSRVGQLLERSSLSVRGQVADMSVIDSVSRELSLETACVGKRIARTSHTAPLADIEEDIHLRGFQCRVELLWLKAIGPDGEYAVDQP
jgi:hypothetical protein